MGTITFQGNPLHLEGTLPTLGQKAPSFTLRKNDLSVSTLEDFSNKVLVLLTVPSLDTPVCDMEVRKFNKDATDISEKVHIVAVSADLPFAQARWCGAAGVSAVSTLSDYYDMNFATQYGVLIEELRLLARAVFVINAEGILTYGQLVPEMTDEPDYAAALDAINTAL